MRTSIAQVSEYAATEEHNGRSEGFVAVKHCLPLPRQERSWSLEESRSCGPGLREGLAYISFISVALGIEGGQWITGEEGGAGQTKHLRDTQAGADCFSVKNALLFHDYPFSNLNRDEDVGHLMDI